MKINFDYATLRKRLGLAQSEFCVFLGLQPPMLCHLEKGKRRVSPRIAILLTCIIGAAQRHGWVNTGNELRAAGSFPKWFEMRAG